MTAPTELIPGTPEWEIAIEVAPRASEAIVDKRSGDAFTQTTLRDVLAALVGGGYRVTLVADGHATSASNGKSEQQIREAMHEQTRARRRYHFRCRPVRPARGGPEMRFHFVGNT
jgi:Isochorismatase family